MNYESLENKKFWVIDTDNYSKNYKKYFNENKVVMGLGDDINLTDNINSGRQIEHKFKDGLNEFLKIKKGDYISWLLKEIVEKDNNRYLEYNTIIGEINDDLGNIYEYKNGIGHILPIRLLKKRTKLLSAYDKINCYKIDEIENSNQLKEFKELEGFDKVDNKNNNFYLRMKYFGLEHIEEKENELVIDLSDLKIKNKGYLDEIKKSSTSDFLLGEFISKRDESIVTRVIGKIKDISVDKTNRIVLDIITKKNKKYEYSSIISIKSYSENDSCKNIINKCITKYNNTIFYGPPGTGKTYNIDNEVLKIIDTATYIEFKNDRNKIHNKTLNLQADNQVRICTFHQSYGYEEFIEGLRPDDKGYYTLEDGLLKQIAIDAIFEGLLYEFKAELLEKVNNKINDIPHEEKKKLALKYINDSSNFDFLCCDQYVLVIDEINRGNISKIFGELITLLEEDKRLGNENEMRLKLPYSKEDFILPPNLHIIGTMNSSDKSIAPIDIALRRRFKFIEIMPDEELLSTINGIDLKEMLKKINARIEYLYDRDHTIGHAYFINNKSLDDIKETLTNKIIPLLQEYFYEDYDRIGLVLGGVGDSEIDKFIVYKESMNPNDLFKDTSEYEFNTINKYHVKSDITEADIKSIYE
ncbi:McrB family protein [Clostridium beijerinckii]|uniref:5-methylcytosine-specific restriction protein B n=1 Tax=Clostridium beijerinckii TaxID=1520 RepID=A0AAX0B2V2_CLOBE|nr:AAA family ATPase [Clostridium beijerinckii]NRT33009.1 5-methylcytosine-specific restriction protein B [Clostridium beijerinckii]NRT47566.1 5-methylcytosine-specific restriction protein B [Clostridium beijerinckii]NRT75299.1 5-methylcytosine-specific restriction protein B [Clostridium beijerinckii]NRT89687.1 5-methylcytosine-specific restriction protein B [Clostridium beijerinckii]NRZ24144.1 5-methylcytosine-specific restriction protein B [Clostridium beijerinckii]